MNNVYDASAIEVLSGLDPVRRRPGMYTDTSRPNHLAQEVIDNSVDEAIAGYASAIQVILVDFSNFEGRVKIAPPWRHAAYERLRDGLDYPALAAMLKE